MLISRHILTSMLTPGATDAIDDEELGVMLTGLGLELEGMQRVGAGLEAILVGRIVSVRPHPDADKLRLCEVDHGGGVRSVVCGAPNVPEAGGKVAVAPVGTRLPGGLEIGAREIRGVHSEGMICSEAELEIGADADGIMVLPQAWAQGSALREHAPTLVDTLYELGITPNRADALGHVGVARDLCVRLDCELILPELALPEVADDPSLVTLQSPQRCGRYFGYAFEGASVGVAPLWMRVALHRLGLRPINAVVDITNYVLLEHGQPLHIFDRKLLAEGRVVIRQARPGEPMTMLDETQLQLQPEDLVIADARAPQALAGVMGGKHSGVESHSTELFLEAAWFHPLHIRRSARRHQLNTDSSFRFERGVDHGEGLRRACARAAALTREFTGARAIGGHEALGERPPTPSIRLRPARSKLVLGLDVPARDARRILCGLEIEVDDRDPDAWSCKPPTHRLDIGIEEDLIEEIVRHYGLDNLPMAPSMPSAPPGLDPTPDAIATHAAMLRDDRLVDALRSVGLREHVAFVFTGAEALAPFLEADPGRRPVGLSNPMREKSGLLRTHMLPGLLEALSLNAARHARPVRLFEFGRVYAWEAERRDADGPTAKIDRQLPTERRRAAILVGGRVVDQADGRQVAGLLLDVLARAGYEAELCAVSDDDRQPWLHPGAQARVELAGVPVAVFGEVHPDLLERFGLPAGSRAAYGEIDIDALPGGLARAFTEVPRFPSTARDLSLEIPAELPAADVVSALRRAEVDAALSGEDPPHLASGDSGDAAIEVIEDYRGEGIPDGQRALLLRLHYRAAARSVTDAEVQSLHDVLVERAMAALRSRTPRIKPR